MTYFKGASHLQEMMTAIIAKHISNGYVIALNDSSMGYDARVELEKGDQHHRIVIETEYADNQASEAVRQEMDNQIKDASLRAIVDSMAIAPRVTTVSVKLIDSKNNEEIKSTVFYKLDENTRLTHAVYTNSLAEIAHSTWSGYNIVHLWRISHYMQADHSDITNQHSD